MSDSYQIDVRLKPDAVENPSTTELELLASVLPELILLMQQQEEAED